MKKHSFRRPLSMLLAVSMTAAMAVGSISTVNAGGDTLPARPGEAGYIGENQPSMHGYSINDLLNWSPETDQYAKFLRAQVPQQEKIAPFAATQANPLLTEEAKSLQLSSDYGNSFFDTFSYNDQFSDYCFNFWQYVDYSASWHGMVTESTPNDLFNPEAPWWDRLYQFGIINMPNPAYTNAAHKNGSQSLGCIFFPRDEHTQLYVYKDENGNFPIADKLIELAEYYGFDGYFINAEERLPADFMPLYDEFVSYMTANGMYMQVYASNPYGQNNQGSWGGIDYFNKDATNFSNWIKKPGSPQGADSLYMNPDPSPSHVNGSVSIMESLGLDARNTVFNTIEAGQTGFSGARGSLFNTYDENLVPRTGIASLGASMVYTGLDEQLFGHTGDNSYEEYRRGDPDYQKYVFARERTWWSGAENQPHYTNDNSYVKEGITFLDKSSTQYTEEERAQLLEAVLNAEADPVATSNDPTRNQAAPGTDLEGKPFQSFRGMSAFISERSVIGGSTFTTNFNTGHGMQYFVDGAVSNDNQWANINIQDIPPTWQWWIDTDGTRLNAEFDYGDQYNKNELEDYQQIGAYQGGSSLVVNGKLDAENTLRLFKTNLSVKDDTKVSITYNKPSATDGSKMELAVIFKNDPETVITFNVPNAGKQTDGWVTKQISLGDYAGEEIATLGLNFDPGRNDIENYQMNIGELKVTDGTSYTPDAPTGLTIDQAFDSTETYLSWDLDDYNEVKQYNVSAVLSDGSEVFLGGIYDSVYYVKSLYGEQGEVTFKLTAVGKDGSESEPAVLTYDFSDKVRNLEVEEKAGYLDVSWDNPAVADYDSLAIDVDFNHTTKTESYSMAVSKDANSARILVPIADGTEYTLTVSSIKDDVKSEAIAVSGKLLDLYSAPYSGKAVANGKNVPTPITMSPPKNNDWWHMYLYKNGELVNTVIRGKHDMPTANEANGCTVVMEDFAKNLSEPVVFNKDLPNDGPITSDMFPDEALLSAVIAQAGSTVEEIANFTGTLDLSGTEVKDLTGISQLTKLTGINLTGCTALEVLDLSGSNLSSIICEDPSALTSIVSADLSNAKFDFSEETPEKAFVDALSVDVNISGQKPSLYPNVSEKLNLDVKREGKPVDMNDIYEEALNDLMTNRGTKFDDLAGADFLAADYDKDDALAVKDLHQIRITDKDGNVSLDTIEINKSGVYTVEYITYDDADYQGKVMYTQTVYVRANTYCLEQVIANAEQMIKDGDLENTVEIVVTKFHEALDHAKEIVAKDGATEQEIIDAATRLVEIINKVEWKQGDKTALEVTIQVAESIESNLDKYVEDCIPAFTEALKKARETYEDGNAMDDDVKEATDALIEAMLNMVMKPDKDALDDLINQATDADLSGYTAESADAVRTALAAAEALAADKNASQKQVDAAAETLKNALAGLVKTNDSDTPAGGNNDNQANDSDTPAGGNSDNDATGNDVTVPVGDGSAPTKTGDGMNAAGMGAIVLLSAAAVIALRKKKAN